MTFLRALVTVTALVGGAALAGPADPAYLEARAAYQKLRGDEAKRKLRHHWLNVAKKFDRVAARWPKSDRAPEALFTAAELYSELSRFSRKPEDLAASEAAYRKLTEAWPRHRLGDDGAFALARLLADRNNDPAGARRVVDAALEAGGGDQLAALKKLRDCLPEQRASRIAQALEKAIAPLKQRPPVPPRAAVPVPELDQAAAAVQARRAPATARPGAEPGEADLEPPAPDDPALGALRLPAIAQVQERLREVRVGERPAPVVDPAVARRLKQAARDGATSELTLAQQLGLKMRRVVIDPGHGGHDSGAIGAGGVREKDVTLGIAVEVARQLEAAGLEVLLTRDNDAFVRLEDRATAANEYQGDLFISIHCNAAPSPRLRGIETYTLNTSGDRYSIRLAARENASSERGVSDLRFILADLATKANTEESTRLARRVQRSLTGTLGARHKGIKDLGTKEALFYVLLGVKMPAILVETSFLSNPEEEKLLGDPEFQAQAALAISEAVKGFLDERQAKLARVD